jgi:hypothetical protein
MPTPFTIEIPPSFTVRVLAVGRVASVLLLPAGTAPEDTQRPGEVSALISFPRGEISLDREGHYLAVGMLAGGYPVAFTFQGGLTDALRFRATLRVVECAA